MISVTDGGGGGGTEAAAAAAATVTVTAAAYEAYEARLNTDNIKLWAAVVNKRESNTQSAAATAAVRVGGA